MLSVMVVRDSCHSQKLREVQRFFEEQESVESSPVKTYESLKIRNKYTDVDSSLVVKRLISLESSALWICSFRGYFGNK